MKHIENESEEVMKKLNLQKFIYLSALMLPGIVYAQETKIQKPQQKQQLETKACRHPSFAREVQCGQIQRPLDPTKVNGKKIDIHYVILPSQDRNKLSDAIFLLAGGPGQSAIDIAGFGEVALKKLNHRRDLVFVDQRGTGLSASLQCPQLENVTEAIEQEQAYKKIDECRTFLQALPHGDLSLYSTSIAVQDLEAVRKKLNYTAINLVGASYGTRVGLEYLRQYPQSVRRLVIDGVVPPEMQLVGVNSQAALDAVFKHCLESATCNKMFPDLSSTWQRLLNQMPIKTKIKHPRLGYELEVPVEKDSLIGLVSRSLYSPNMTSALPYAINQAAAGNLNPLITLSGSMNLVGVGNVNMGMHFSVFCGEMYARPMSGVSSDDFTAMNKKLYDRVCEKWPRASIPKEFFEVPTSPAPVLLLSGGIDPVTPISHGDVIAKKLGKNALHISLKQAGHGLLAQGCIPEVVHKFLNEKDHAAALKVDTACVRQIPRPLVWLPPQAPTKNKTSSANTGEKP